MKKMIAVFVAGYVVGGLSLWMAEPWHPLVIALPDDGKITEEVEQVFFRTEKQHSGCPSNGFLRVCGQPRQIEAYGISKAVWPHKCSGCGMTNEIYDARWPQIKVEWRAK